MDKNEINQDSPQEVDWEDDSGEIHTVASNYNITWEDGWQKNNGIRNRSIVTGNQHQSKMRYVRGMQTGGSVTTDDYRVVIPAYIIGTIVIIVLCIVVTFVYLPLGIFFDIVGIVWIIGLWAKAPFTKWKNQKKKLEEEKPSE
ncbi:MAG: hypothetical protein NC089_02630 [Bacteroides sp.]|nr:hypothetical protein [Bacteroides sp.]MCM1550735.1 hypothetical protein [Clostridium sp.]